MSSISKYKIKSISFLFLLVITALVLVKYKPFTSKVDPENIIEIQPQEPQGSHKVDSITVGKGDTLNKILSQYNISVSDIDNIVKNAKAKKINVSNLKLGQNIQVKYSTEKNLKTPIYISIDVDNKQKMEINKEQDIYKVNSIVFPFKRDIVRFYGTIQDSIISSALKAGVPMRNILEVVNTYSHQIDFQREVREGDKFTILVEKFIPEDVNSGVSPYFGKTLYSSLDLSGDRYKIYRYKTSDGVEEFFDENYSSVRRSLLRTPVVVARISSGFGMRKHPISGYTAMHQGVDFAAPMGSPIYAAGNGVIAEIGRKGSYGNYIRISHSNDLHTAYAHARSFAKGLQKGSRIKQGQVIAYVGMTGAATGPHLHYEVIVGNKNINPLSLKLMPTRKLSGVDKENFKRHREVLDSLINVSG